MNSVSIKLSKYDRFASAGLIPALVFTLKNAEECEILPCSKIVPKNTDSFFQDCLYFNPLLSLS